MISSHKRNSQNWGAAVPRRKASSLKILRHRAVCMACLSSRGPNIQDPKQLLGHRRTPPSERLQNGSVEINKIHLMDLRTAPLTITKKTCLYSGRPGSLQKRQKMKNISRSVYPEHLHLLESRTMISQGGPLEALREIS